jgi:hypothetical protein
MCFIENPDSKQHIPVLILAFDPQIYTRLATDRQRKIIAPSGGRPLYSWGARCAHARGLFSEGGFVRSDSVVRGACSRTKKRVDYLAIGVSEFSIFFGISRLIPTMNSKPSELQWATTPENCSLCHFTINFDPTAIGRLARRQAPEDDVSSIFTRDFWGTPASSVHHACATAIMQTLFSLRGARIPSISADLQFPVPKERIFASATVLQDGKTSMPNGSFKALYADNPECIFVGCCGIDDCIGLWRRARRLFRGGTRNRLTAWDFPCRMLRLNCKVPRPSSPARSH